MNSLKELTIPYKNRCHLPGFMKRQNRQGDLQTTETLFSGIKDNRYYFAGAMVLLLVLVLFTYSKSFKNSFVDWDDFTYVVNNDLVRTPGDTYFKDLFLTPVSSNYHPLTILSMRISSNVCGTCPAGISPAPFIRGNVVLHMLNTLLVFILVFLLCKRDILISFLVAAVFGVHPMHVESVAWISERKDVLYTFFFSSGTNSLPVL